MMEQRLGRWVTKFAAMTELEISLSTLDRRIRTGEVEYARQGHTVHVLIEGPEPVSDRELLETARQELLDSKRAVAELNVTVSRLKSEIRQLKDGLDAVRLRETRLSYECGELRRQNQAARAARRLMTAAIIFLSALAFALFVPLVS